MRAHIVKIGNSRGIRIPKPFIEQCGFRRDVDLDIRGHELVIHAHNKPRMGWESAFQKMAQRGDDNLLDGPLVRQTSWDDTEWEWK